MNRPSRFTIEERYHLEDFIEDEGEFGDSGRSERFRQGSSIAWALVFTLAGIAALAVWLF